MSETLTPREFIAKLLGYVTVRYGEQAEDLSAIMDRHPEKVTTKTAFKINGKRAAFREIIDWITDEQQRIR